MELSELLKTNRINKKHRPRAQQFFEDFLNVLPECARVKMHRYPELNVPADTPGCIVLGDLRISAEFNREDCSLSVITEELGSGKSSLHLLYPDFSKDDLSYVSWDEYFKVTGPQGLANLMLDIFTRRQNVLNDDEIEVSGLRTAQKRMALRLGLNYPNLKTGPEHWNNTGFLTPEKCPFQLADVNTGESGRMGGD